MEQYLTMVQTIYIEDFDYKITDEEEFDDLSEEVIFEIDGEFVLANFDDMFGVQIDKVWKIIQ